MRVILHFTRTNDEHRTYRTVDFLDIETGEVVSTQTLWDEEASIVTLAPKYPKCRLCGQRYEQGDLREGYCPECHKSLPHCVDCGRVAEEYTLRNGRCPECHQKWLKENNGKVCPHCGKLGILKRVNSISSTLLCEDCAEAFDRPQDNIDGYHSMKDREVPSIVLDNGENLSEEPLLGIELEIEGEEDFCYDCSDSCRHCPHEDTLLEARNEFLKQLARVENDGSLCNKGAEFVFFPMTASAIKLYKDSIKSFFDYCHDDGYVGDTSCNGGFHIHIDATDFMEGVYEQTAAKLLYLFEKFYKPLVNFSRRNFDEINDWCRPYRPNDGSPFSIANAVKQNAKSGNHHERYHMVNLTNQNTIEIRLWKSTMNWQTFWATVKLTRRLALLAKNTPARELCKMTWTDILGDDDDILDYWNRI